MTNSLPRPAPSLAAVSVPPCSSTSIRASVRPIPSPPSECASVRSPWVKRSKTRRESLGRDADAGVADPENGLAARPSLRRRRCDRPAECTWRRCSAGCRRPAPGAWDPHRATRGVAGSETVTVWPRVSISSRVASSASVTTLCSVVAVLRSSIFSRVRRAASSKSSSSRARCRLCRSMTSVARRTSGSRSAGPRRVRMAIRIGASGLPELVGEHGDELFLRPVGRLGRGASRLLATQQPHALLFDALAVRDVGDRAHRADRRPRVLHGINGDTQRPPPTVHLGRLPLAAAPHPREQAPHRPGPPRHRGAPPAAARPGRRRPGDRGTLGCSAR